MSAWRWLLVLALLKPMAAFAESSREFEERVLLVFNKICLAEHATFETAMKAAQASGYTLQDPSSAHISRRAIWDIGGRAEAPAELFIQLWKPFSKEAFLCRVSVVNFTAQQGILSDQLLAFIPPCANNVTRKLQRDHWEGWSCSTSEKLIGFHSGAWGRRDNFSPRLIMEIADSKL